MKKIPEIQKLTRDYREVQDVLDTLVHEVDDHIRAIMDRSLPDIKKYAKAATVRREILEAAIGANPGLFKRPRTVVFHGIKVGFKKGKGKVEWKDDERVLRYIHRYYPDLADVLIRTKETPNKDALATCEASFLKKCGVTVVESGDEVVIKPVDTEGEKLVKAFLKEAGIKEGA